MKNPNKMQKIESHTEAIKKELELLSIQYQSSMARISTLTREIQKEAEDKLKEKKE